jgi:hypothetical protein
LPKDHNVDDGCFKLFNIIHELVHLLGFHHLHRSPERDNFIKIAWENVKTEKFYDLNIHEDRELSDFGVGYDYESILHKNSRKFSKNGERTILPIDPQFNDVIGQRNRLSEGDITKINRMYKCDERENEL